ncbi:MAG: 23S rRNA (guanosine(2251)-2'-O)-methyltransferase RlmB [Acidobacteria bacterium]|nr:23S rRNA (guanosine(2251)-2'-O)-methyltransferase RlmB [Acidobacteriota bacterium]MBP7475428.1 23S rRNA (guanosine(2251)-2'-O)-methyltransferase RlmB [Pyrinomonadaceae bacterium]MBP9108426.1 23S rRNA (guanosine(2251)-2'-O)-methyltransferase RlmB [Pyrinomonadaceae bacterium]
MKPKWKDRGKPENVSRNDGGKRRRDAERPEPERSPSSQVIYGALPVLEALRAANRRIDKVWIADGSREARLSEIIELCRSRSIAFNRVPRETFAKYLDSGVNHQGVMAFAASVEYVDVDEIFDAQEAEPLILILDGVEDPRNLGAILRTAECAGTDGIIIPERRAVGLNDTVAKSSAGAIEFVKVAKVSNLNQIIKDLKNRNIWVVGTSGDATMDYTEWDWTRPTALVLGAEGSGLHRLVAENCDVLVKIPMYGKIDSLNVSVAAGVVLFEAKRQRNI